MGIEAHVERQTLGFDFDTLAVAWNALAGITTAHIPAAHQQEAQAAVIAAIYSHGDGPHHLRNTTQFILGQIG